MGRPRSDARRGLVEVAPDRLEGWLCSVRGRHLPSTCLGALRCDHQEGVAVAARIRRLRDAARPGVLLALVAVGATGCSTPAENAPAARAATSTSATAATAGAAVAGDACFPLGGDAVTDMVQALPQLAAEPAGVDLTGLRAQVTTGVAALRANAEGAQDPLKSSALSAADAIEAYAADPANTQRQTALSDALNNLDIAAAKGCK